MSRSLISHVAAVFIVLSHIPLQAADSRALSSPTLERILKNWQARQDRTKSLHMAWDTKAEPNNTDKDAGFRMLHHELWMDGENRSRLQQALTRGAGSQLTRFGKTEASYAWQFGSAQPFLADIWMAGDPPKTQGYELNWEVDPRMAVASVRPLYIALRPLVSQARNQRADDFRLVSENEVVDQRPLVRLSRTDPESKLVEDFWVDPARGDTVAQWTWDAPKQPLCSATIEWEHGADGEWGLRRWTTRLGPLKKPWETAESTVTAFAINAIYPPDALRVTFPVGTIVFDRRTKEEYVIAADGSRTNVSKFGSPKGLKLYDVLEMPVDFRIEPQSLPDALAFFAARYQINVVVDKVAFQRQGIDLTTEVSASLPGLPVRNLLWVLLGQVHKAVGFQIRDGLLLVAPFSRKELDAKVDAPPDKQRVERALDAHVDFAIQPQSFQDAMDLIAARYEIRVQLDQKAFEQAGIDTATEIRVAATNLPLRQVLTLLLQQFQKPVGFEIRGGALVVAPKPQPQNPRASK